MRSAWTVNDVDMIGPRMVWEMDEVREDVNLVGSRVLWDMDEVSYHGWPMDALAIG